MSEKDDYISPENQELENELRRLVPSRLSANFINELALEHARLASAPVTKPRSRWMLPTLAACTLVFCGTTFWKVRSGLNSNTVVRSAMSNQATTVSTQTASPAPARIQDEFFPVSNEGRLIRASSGGIIDSELGPRERLELDYEDVHHWRNPGTATDIRIFTPRREVILIPVQTD